MNTLFAFFGGLLFGVGLIVSGMTNPAKVIGFLNLAGNWDPSLAFVMAGAIAVATISFVYAKRHSTSLLNLPIQLPTACHIDGRLVGGSALFGIGWGLAGICPGPALILLGSANEKGVIFITAMIAGMGLIELLEHRKHSHLPPNFHHLLPPKNGS